MITSISEHCQSLVNHWVASGSFDHALSDAFKQAATEDQAARLRSVLMAPGDPLFPKIVELAPQYLSNHFAAFSVQTNTIYVDPDLKSFPGLADSALAHELGHWVDYQLHGESTDHASIRSFAHSLNGWVGDTEEDSGPLHGQAGAAEKLKLPNGEVVNAQFFDTSIHVSWIKEQLPFLSADATQIIKNAQNDTDSFNASTYETIGPLHYSPYGLQTHSPSHFDNNNIRGGLEAIRSRWENGINRFDSTFIRAVTSEQFLERNNVDALANPTFWGPNAGIQLLLYRFGQINHAFEDFYSHSNWVESAKAGIISSSKLLEGGLELPIVLQPGDQIPGTNLVVAQSGPNWSKKLKKSGTGSYSRSKYDVYWNVDSTDPSKGGGVVSATTIDGKTIYGLATGATNGAIYNDPDFSVFLRDPRKTGLFQKEYFRGFDHGGIAGRIYGQWVGPLNKDKDSDANFLAAKKFANLQLQNEWDRMGNLIYKSYGEAGLRRFADFALRSQYARDAYVSTFSSPGARYFGNAALLNLASPFVFSASGSESDSVSLSSSLPLIRNIRLFGAEFLEPDAPFGSYQDRYQFFDQATGAWLDTDFNDISIHHELDDEGIAKLTTPSLLQHGARGERAAWSLTREDSIDKSATNYFVESINPSVTVYIDNFDIYQDRIILVDDTGKEVHLPDGIYDVTKVDQLTTELAKYGISLNFRPEVELDPAAILIKESELASPVVIEASSVAVDVKGEALFFTGYDGSVPFLSLVEGVLRAQSVDPVYAGKTYTAYVDISDGVSVARTVPVRIAVAPKIAINGQSFDSESSFKLNLIGTTSQAFEIIAKVSDHLEGTLDRFLSIATSIGSSSGTPTGFSSSDLVVNLSDDLDSGNVSFWLQEASGTLKPLSIESLADGGFDLWLNGDQIAQLTPLAKGSVVPMISGISYRDVLDDGLGVRLNQSFADLAPKNPSVPWVVTLSMDLYREAAYANQVGLFLFDRVTGNIVDASTGMVQDTPDSIWYEAADRYAVWTGTTDNMKASKCSTTFRVNGLVDLDSVALMPFMKTQIEGRPVYFSTFDSFNSDGAKHVSTISSNTFGFEDTLGMGDGDFDDIILRINSMSLA